MRDANVLTLDDARPRAETVAVRGREIVAVGGDGEVAALAGPATTVLSLAGKTIVPGFIDAHQHRIGDGPSRLGREVDDIIDDALGQGLTTIDELYVDEARLAELVDLDRSRRLRLHVNAYLPVNQNSPEGTPFDAYYVAYDPRQELSANVRVAGLKVFTDFDNADILLWRQRDLDEFVLARHRDGWQLALKTVAVSSLDMILLALERAAVADPSVADARARLEHNLFATPEQIERIAELGIVPVINLNMPGQAVGDASIDELVSRQQAGSYVPWRSIFEAGVAAAGCSGFPSYYVDEPTGAPFGSPIHMIYQAVTRVGNLGQRSPAGLLDQALTAEQALRSLTINAARASFEEDLKGSISAGKLADIVVLSADPLAVGAEEINDIEVLMTIVAGSVEHCALAAGCPLAGGAPTTQPPLAPPATPTGGRVDLAGARVQATSELSEFPAANVIDGTADRWNAAAAAAQAIDITLPAPTDIGEVRLHVAQDPGGHSVHELWIGPSDATAERVHLFDGDTFDGDVLVYRPDGPISGVQLVRVVTLSVAGDLYPAWREIELFSPG